MRVPRAIALPVVCLTAVFGVAFASPATAQEAPTTDPGEAAAGWLAGQFVDGNRLQTVFGGESYDDAGLTADGVLALDAADVAQDTAAAATEWLAANVATYVGDGAADGESYAGALAKLAIVADAQGVDPAGFGDVDLLGRLAELQDAETGRYVDRSEYGDYSNALTQSLAIIAFERAGSGAPASAVAYLASQQCADGGFDIQFDDPAGCVSEPDATAFAAQALLAAGDEAADAALDHLAATQAADGSFVGDGVANTNSTGLAAQALRAGGLTDEADAAVAYVVGAQVGCAAAEAQRGAIPYVPGAVDDRATRATAQAVGGVAGVSLLDVSNDGDAAGIPALACAPAPTTPAPTTAPVTTAPPAQGGDLPATGSAHQSLLAVGSLLVAAGAGAVALSRQRRRSS